MTDSDKFEQENNNSSNDSSRDFGCDYLKAIKTYLALAENSLEHNQEDVAMHQFILAFLISEKHIEEPSKEVIDGMHEAFNIASKARNRQMCSYILEIAKKYISQHDYERACKQIQKLRSDRMAGFGINPENFQDVAKTIAKSIEEATGLNVEGIQAGFSKRNSPTTQKEISILRKSSNTLIEEDLSKLDFTKLDGYDSAIEAVRKFGIGRKNDKEFIDFIHDLNLAHGLNLPPTPDSIIVETQSYSDAERFISAMAVEIHLPIIRINVTDTPQGIPALCVTGKVAEPPVYDRRIAKFNRPAILILDEYDLWSTPINETLGLPVDEYNFNPGIRETISIISAAVNDPQVVVIASVHESCIYKVPAFELLSPYKVIKLDMPNQSERKALYRLIKSKCPSIKGIEMHEFINLTKNLSRTDILYASQDAVEEAYKKSIEEKSFIMVRPSDLYQKLAQYQDQESPEYKRLENAVVTLTFKDFDELESLFNKGIDK